VGHAPLLLAGGSERLLWAPVKNGGQFLAERFIRLVIPFVVGFIFLSPLLAYFEGLNHLTYRGSLLQMYPTFFARIQFMWSSQWLGRYGYHLWFLAFLFFFCLLALPLFLYLKRDPGQRWLMWIVGLCERPGGSLLFVVPIFLIQWQHSRCITC
jgi:glucans biosynthesis protein C